MTLQINWLSAEITEICEAESRLKQLQVKASMVAIDEEAVPLADKTELMLAVPSIIRALRVVLQERKVRQL